MPTDDRDFLFKEEIAELWGYEQDEVDIQDNPRQAAHNLNAWFDRNFRKRGLKTAPIGKREVVHKQILADWIAFISDRKKE